MSETEMDDVASATGWTTANIRKLIASIRRSVPESEKTRNYRTVLSAVDWNNVAFPPFSPEECREKWKSMMEKMRRLRSLPELIAEAEEAISDPLRHRKIHPELPKFPSPPKIVYMRKHFSRLKKKHPRLTMTKIVRMAFRKYDKLPDGEKAKYKKEHALRLKEYKRKMQDFCQKNDLPLIRATEQKKKVSAKEDEGLPEKPPPNALVLFIKEHAKADRLGMGFLRDIGHRWRKLSETEKQKYSTRCGEMKREYNAKLLEYLHRFDELEKQQIIEEKGIRLPKKSSKKHSGWTLPGEPRIPSQTGYVYFAKDRMKSLKEKMSSHTDCIANAKELWCKLPVKEKEHYKERIHAKMKQYSENLKKWFMTLTSEDQTEYLKRNPSKLQFLDARKKMVNGRKELHLCQPSDSEDEDIVIDSEEGEDIWSSYEDENGEDEADGYMFEMYS